MYSVMLISFLSKIQMGFYPIPEDLSGFMSYPCATGTLRPPDTGKHLSSQDLAVTPLVSADLWA